MISLKRTLRKILEEKKHNDESLAEAFHACWHVKVYSDGSAIRSGYPTPAELRATVPFYEGVVGMRQSTAGDTSSPASYWEPWGLYNYYTAWFTCYVYVKEAKTISTTYYADDHSSMYLNDIQIKTAASCVSTPVTMDLLAGWNKIDFIYSEGGGGAGVYFTPRIETLVDELLPFRLNYKNEMPITVRGELL